MSYKSQGLRDHDHPQGLVWRDMIEDYYTRFIEIWQTSQSVDEAHHRILDTLDAEISTRTALHSRVNYLKVMGVQLRELPPHCIDWEAMSNFALSLNSGEE
jgi:hypothetical protein